MKKKKQWPSARETRMLRMIAQDGGLLRTEAPEGPVYEPEFLIGCRAITAFVNQLVKPAKFSENAIYRMADRKRPPAKRLPAGKVCGQLIASPAKIRAYFETLADGADAGDANGDGPAGEMTTDSVVTELSRRWRPDR